MSVGKPKKRDSILKQATLRGEQTQPNASKPQRKQTIVGEKRAAGHEQPEELSDVRRASRSQAPVIPIKGQT